MNNDNYPDVEPVPVEPFSVVRNRTMTIIRNANEMLEQIEHLRGCSRPGITPEQRTSRLDTLRARVLAERDAGAISEETRNAVTNADLTMGENIVVRRTGR